MRSKSGRGGGGNLVHAIMKDKNIRQSAVKALGDFSLLDRNWFTSVALLGTLRIDEDDAIHPRPELLSDFLEDFKDIFS